MGLNEASRSILIGRIVGWSEHHNREIWSQLPTETAPGSAIVST